MDMWFWEYVSGQTDRHADDNTTNDVDRRQRPSLAPYTIGVFSKAYQNLTERGC